MDSHDNLFFLALGQVSNAFRIGGFIGVVESPTKEAVKTHLDNLYYSF